MSPASKEIIPSPIPVLTDTVGDDTAGIPTLTEIHIETPSLLSDAQCQQLAKQIAPQLATLLQAKLTQNFDTLLQEVQMEIQANLPDLIRSALKHKHPL